MPRPSPLSLIRVPKINPNQPLPRKHDYAHLLGFRVLPKAVSDELAHIIPLLRATQGLVRGHTPKRVAAELKRCKRKLRGEQRNGHPDKHLRRMLSDPHWGLDFESFERLAPLAAAPTSELLAAVEARHREVERLPRINPQWGTLVSAAAVAQALFRILAQDVRDQPGACWHFVLAMLDDAGFPTEGLHQHPERLTSLLGGRL